MKKQLLVIASLLLIVSFVLSACAPVAAPPVVQTVVVTKEVPKEVVVTKEVVVQPTAAPVTAGTLPRNETMYFNGQQWGPVVGWNPYSTSNN